jgi:signal transduction histidine kinase
MPTAELRTIPCLARRATSASPSAAIVVQGIGELELRGRVAAAEALAVSERSARQAAEKAEAEARRLARLQEQLVAEVAHDLRTPIMAIQLSVATLLAGTTVTAAQSRKLARVDASIARIGEMLHTLRDFTQARLAGGIPIEMAPVDVGQQARRAAAEMQAAHPGRSVHLVVEGDVTIEADGHRLMQVLSNLLGNAVQHGCRDAPVSLAVRRAGETVVLQVHNGGPAIPPALLPNLFQPFRQGASSRYGGEHTGSLGLGLFIVHEVVHAHGGKVSVDSTEDLGTTFTVELPLEQLETSMSESGPPW